VFRSRRTAGSSRLECTNGARVHRARIRVRTILSRDFFVRAVPAWDGGPKETDLIDDDAFA
jgi:hypothetical protein